MDELRAGLQGGSDQGGAQASFGGSEQEAEVQKLQDLVQGLQGEPTFDCRSAHALIHIIFSVHQGCALPSGRARMVLSCIVSARVCLSTLQHHPCSLRCVMQAESFIRLVKVGVIASICRAAGSSRGGGTACRGRSKESCSHACQE